MADNEKPWIPGEENERTIPPVSVTAKAPTEAEKAEYEANLPWIPKVGKLKMLKVARHLLKVLP